MKLFLMVSPKPGQVHGVDYTKGLEDGSKCGQVHEFCTRRVNGKCAVIFLTEEEVGEGADSDSYVELTPIRNGRKLKSIVWGS